MSETMTPTLSVLFFLLVLGIFIIDEVFNIIELKAEFGQNYALAAGVCSQIFNEVFETKLNQIKVKIG